MKRNITLICFLIPVFYLNSQNSWIYERENDIKFEDYSTLAFTDAITDLDGNVYACGLHATETYSNFFFINGILSKSDHNGNLVKEVILQDDLVNTALLFCKMKNDKQSFITVEIQTDKGTDDNATWAVKTFDLDLNQLSEQKVAMGKNNYEDYTITHSTMSNGNIIITAVVTSGPNQALFLIIDPEGNIVNSASNFNNDFNSGMSIAEKLDGSGYFVFCDEVKILDNSFKTIDSLEFYSTYEIGNTIIKVSNGYYLNTYYGDTLNLLKLNGNLDIETRAQMLGDYDPFILESLTMSNDSFLYSGRYDSYLFYIDKFDLNLNPIWSNIIDINVETNILGLSLNADEDGSLIISGQREDEGNSFTNGLLIKTDANGLISNIDELSLTNIRAYTVFPNPSSGDFHIHLQNFQEATSIHFFDANGRMVLEHKSLQDGENHFDLSFLDAGIYYYQLQSGDKFLGKNKWIKLP